MTSTLGQIRFHDVLIPVSGRRRAPLDRGDDGREASDRSVRVAMPVRCSVRNDAHCSVRSKARSPDRSVLGS